MLLLTMLTLAMSLMALPSSSSSSSSSVCNRTITSPQTVEMSLLSSPELRARLEGSPASCEVRVRSPRQEVDRGSVVRIRFGMLKVGDVEVRRIVSVVLIDC